MPLGKTSNARNGLHLVELLVKGVPWNLQNHRLLTRLQQQRSASKVYWCSSGTDVMEVTSHILKFGFKAYFMRWNPYLTLLKRPKTRD